MLGRPHREREDRPRAFLWALLTNGPASATNTFFASWAWHHSLSTDVRGLFPMRVVPTSWMISPPIEMPSSVGVSVRARAPRFRSVTLPPIASMIDVKVRRMCRACARSCSDHSQWKRRTGMPQRSTTSGSISQKLFSFGIISPRPAKPTNAP